MSLLTIIGGFTGAAIRCGITVPTTVITNPSNNVQKLLAYAQDSGRDLLERWNWRALNKSATITGDGVTTLWPLPSDFKRLCPSDKSQTGPFVSSVRPLLPLSGPVNDEDLNQAKAWPAMPVVPLWRLIGSNVEIWPALAAAEVVTYNYYSKAWIRPVAGADQTIWALDTDTSLIEEDTVMKGTVWRWKASQGLDYAEEFRQYELSADRNAGQEGTERIVSTASPRFGLADDCWPGTITYPGP